jgi:hypothetical protein
VHDACARGSPNRSVPFSAHVSQHSVGLSHRTPITRCSLDLTESAWPSTGGIIVPVTAPAAVEPVDDQYTVGRAGASPDLDDEQRQLAIDLNRLMDLAESYARRLVAAAVSPPHVLLLVHQGDLDIVNLDGPDPDTRVLPRLLAERQASSAVLVLDADRTIVERADHHVAIVGETVDGAREERHYRVRPCGRTRRLTRLFDRDANEVPGLARRLFAPRSAPGA